MNVYIVSREIAYEGGSVIEAHSSLDSAIKKVDELSKGLTNTRAYFREMSPESGKDGETLYSVSTAFEAYCVLRFTVKTI